MAIQLEITFFFDVICPWSYVAKRRLDRVVAEMQSSASADVFSVSLATCPLLSSAGRNDGRVVEAGMREGILFAGKTRHEPNTVDAHRLILHHLRHSAAGHSAAETGAETAALMDALFAAHFVHGADVANLGVLVGVATRFGHHTHDVLAFLEGDELREDVLAMDRRARALLVHTTPWTSFKLYFNSVKSFEFAIGGTQEARTLARVIQRSVALLSRRITLDIGDEITHIASHL